MAKKEKCQDVYGEPIVYHYPNAVVTVYRPILTDEERARRMEKIKEAAARLLMAVEEAEERNAKNHA